MTKSSLIAMALVGNAAGDSGSSYAIEAPLGLCLR